MCLQSTEYVLRTDRCNFEHMTAPQSQKKLLLPVSEINYFRPSTYFMLHVTFTAVKKEEVHEHSSSQLESRIYTLNLHTML
jgi:hypothetical protein